MIGHSLNMKRSLDSRLSDRFCLSCWEGGQREMNRARITAEANLGQRALPDTSLSPISHHVLGQAVDTSSLTGSFSRGRALFTSLLTYIDYTREEWELANHAKRSSHLHPLTSSCCCHIRAIADLTRHVLGVRRYARGFS